MGTSECAESVFLFLNLKVLPLVAVQMPVLSVST